MTYVKQILDYVQTEDWFSIIKLSHKNEIKYPKISNLKILGVILKALATKNILVVCHGRKHRKLNIDYKTTKFLDIDPTVEPD